MYALPVVEGTWDRGGALGNGPRAAEVPFLTLFEPRSSRPAEDRGKQCQGWHLSGSAYGYGSAAKVPGFSPGLAYSNSTVTLPPPGTVASRVDMVPSGA